MVFIYWMFVDIFLVNYVLQEEVFGLVGLIVIVFGVEDMMKVVEVFEGQLIVMIYMEVGDIDRVQGFFLILEWWFGRILVNGFLIGVEVVDVMVYGGFYLVLMNFGVILVGMMVICCWLWLVSYQNFLEVFLLDELRD